MSVVNIYSATTLIVFATLNLISGSASQQNASDVLIIQEPKDPGNVNSMDNSTGDYYFRLAADGLNPSEKFGDKSGPEILRNTNEPETYNLSFKRDTYSSRSEAPEIKNSSKNEMEVAKGQHLENTEDANGFIVIGHVAHENVFPPFGNSTAGWPVVGYNVGGMYILGSQQIG